MIWSLKYLLVMVGFFVATSGIVNGQFLKPREISVGPSLIWSKGSYGHFDFGGGVEVLMFNKFNKPNAYLMTSLALYDAKCEDFPNCPQKDSEIFNYKVVGFSLARKYEAGRFNFFGAIGAADLFRRTYDDVYATYAVYKANGELDYAVWHKSTKINHQITPQLRLGINFGSGKFATGLNGTYFFPLMGQSSYGLSFYVSRKFTDY